MQTEDLFTIKGDYSLPKLYKKGVTSWTCTSIYDYKIFPNYDSFSQIMFTSIQKSKIKDI